MKLKDEEYLEKVELELLRKYNCETISEVLEKQRIKFALKRKD